MAVILLIVRLSLALVFLVAAGTKLADMAGTRRGITSFGVPQRLARPLGWALPLLELAVAVLLVPGITAWIGGLGALGLLAGLSAGIAVNLSRGNAPDCHCFGQLYSEPIGTSTLVRNGVLALVALFVVVAGRANPGVDPFAWFLPLTTAERAGILLGALAVSLLAVQCWLLVRLERHQQRLFEGLSAALNAGSGSVGSGTLLDTVDHVHDDTPMPLGLPVGSIAPRFTLPDLHGSPVTLDDLRAEGKPVMLFFTSPTCNPCVELMPEIGRWQREHPTRLTIAVIGEGTIEANAPKVDETGLQDVLLQRRREVAEAYNVTATPAAVIVYPEGVVGSPVALGADSIRGLLGQILELLPPAPIVLQDQAPVRNSSPNGSNAGRHSVQIGDTLPDVTVTEIMGETVRLADVIQGETLVLFWSSGCGFCREMEPRLKAWEASPPPGAPKLLVVLSATSGGKQVVSFRSRIVIDRDGATARALRANGTPMGILVDAEGRIASNVAAGEDEVMEIAEGRGREPGAARTA